MKKMTRKETKSAGRKQYDKNEYKPKLVFEMTLHAGNCSKEIL